MHCNEAYSAVYSSQGRLVLRQLIAVTMIHIEELAVKHTCLSLLLRITGLSIRLKVFNQCHQQVLGSTDMPYFLSLDQEAMSKLASKND